jgi:hypothetical protein
MLLKAPGLRRTSCSLAVFAAVLFLLSCSSYKSPTTGGGVSGLRFRAFVSNPAHPNSVGGGSPVVEIMDATKDLLSGFVVSLASSASDAGMMSVSPNHDRTLVMSPKDSKLVIVDNVKESVVGSVTLPGPSESFFIWTDNHSAFIAIPSAPVTAQAPGVVEQLDSSSGSVTATVPIPGARFLVPSPSGSQILVFSNNADTVVLLTPSLLGAAGQPSSIAQCTTVQAPACILPATFDRPIWAVFDASGSTAYVVSCGPECGGKTAAAVSSLDMTNTGNPAQLVLAFKPMPAGTTALLQGNQLYVAGTQNLAGTLSGVLSVINLTAGLSAVDCTSATPTNCQTTGIPDGYHDRIQMGSNGQLFVGSRFCTGATCLAMLDTVHSAVTLPSTSGDVTGIEPIPNRNAVYVCQGGLLRVYDTTTDALENIPPLGQPNVIGQAVDVKAVDF